MSSSMSKRRRPAMGRRLPSQVAQATLDLRVDVERRLAARDAARVAGLDQCAELLADAGIGGRPGQVAELRLDVERRLAAGDAAGVAGGEHLADLGVALGRVDRR